MVPSALRITGQDLDAWSDKPKAESQLPVLVRRLLSAQLYRGGRIHFRGDIGVRLAGYDGITDIGETVLDAPVGLAVWELSVNARPGDKATEDYSKRTETPLEVNPAATSYVALTSRHWPAKNAWAKKKQAEGGWREVRALDADDLARWLECSPSVAAWFSCEALNRPIGQIADPQSLLAEWSRWTNPSLPPATLLVGRDEAVNQILTWARAAPAILPVRGESHEEALHFAAAVLTERATDESLKSRVVVARNSEALEWLLTMPTAQPLILLAASPDAERGTSSTGAHHLLIAYERGERLAGREFVDPAPLERTALAALLERVLEPGRAHRVAWTSGGSVGALQRALGRSARPAWASTPLPPEVRAMLLVGAWSPQEPGDRAVVELLSGRTAADVDGYCVSLEVAGALRRKTTGAWMWRSAQDAWALFGRHLTPGHLRDFAGIFIEAFEEVDPEAGASLTERLWIAVKGERRRHSSMLRAGLAGSLAFVATSSPHDMSVRPVERRAQVAAVVRRVLSAPWQRWAAVAPELPVLAEAAPDAFLDALEESLVSGEQGVAKLFAIDQGGLGPSPHVHLVWALETLGWDPTRLRRVAHALARLAAVDPGGPLATRPTPSLRALLFPLWPQTFASVRERLGVLVSLWAVAPMVAWKVGLDLIPTALNGRLTPSYRPVFLPEPPAPRPPERMTLDVEMMAGVRDFLLAHAEELPDRWADILNLVGRWPEEVGAPILHAMLERASAIRSRDAAGLAWRAAREFLVHVLLGAKYGKRQLTEELARARKIYQSLEPEDPIRRVAWLFAYDPKSPDVVHLEWDEEAPQYSQLRRMALQPLLRDSDVVGTLSRLLQAVPAPAVLGFALGEVGDGAIEPLLFGPDLVPGDARRDLVGGFVVAKNNVAGASWLMQVLTTLVRSGRQDEAAWAASQLIPGNVLWDVMDAVGGGLVEMYWGRLPHLYSDLTADERLRAIRHLIVAQRPAMALEVLSKWNRKAGALPPSSLILDVLERSMRSPDILKAIGDGGSVGYRISCALALLEQPDGDDLVRVIRVEACFLPLLDHFGGAPRLFRALGETPALFAEAVDMAYHQAAADEEDDEQRRSLDRLRRQAGDLILRQWKGTPGETAPSPEERDRFFERWCREVAGELRVKGLQDAVWSELACVLARGPSADGIWPCVPARRFLEEGGIPIWDAIC